MRLCAHRLPASLPPGTGSRGRRGGPGMRAGCGARRRGAARGLTLAPIWLPHWPAWMCTISLMLGACGGRLRDAGGRAGAGAGCGGSVAPAARSYRLGPARRARPGVIARGQSGDAAAECGRAAASAPRIPAPPRAAAPPPAAPGVWGPRTRKEGLASSREDNRSPPGPRPQPRLPSLSHPSGSLTPGLCEEGLSCPHLCRDQPHLPPRKANMDASQLSVLCREGADQVL